MSESTRNRNRDRPTPSLTEASRADGVNPPQNRRAPQVRKDQDTGERMYDVEPEDERQRMKTPVCMRRPIDATRGRRTMLRPFGPRGRLALPSEGESNLHGARR